MPPNGNEGQMPQCLVTVGDTLLKSSEFMMESVDIHLSAGSRSNSCNVNVLCGYDYKNGKMTGDAASTIAAGKKVTVKLGYNSPKEVFIGYINSVSTEFSSEGAVISFSCLDARGMLMGNSSHKSYENKSVKQIIEGLFDSVKSYTGGTEVSVSAEADKENPLTQHGMDDYSYICTLAKLTGSSFCMTGTKLRFVDNIFNSASVQETYTWGKDLMSFNRTVELAEQLGAVTVSGTSPDSEEDFSVTVKPKSGGKKTGDKLSSSVGAKDKEIISSMVRSRKEAKVFAESLMQESSMKLCSGSATVLGNQELTPGGKITFERLDPSVSGTYYITSVNHRFGSGGFMTVIGFCSDGV